MLIGLATAGVPFGLSLYDVETCTFACMLGLALHGANRSHDRSGLAFLYAHGMIFVDSVAFASNPRRPRFVCVRCTVVPPRFCFAVLFLYLRVSPVIRANVHPCTCTCTSSPQVFLPRDRFPPGAWCGCCVPRRNASQTKGHGSLGFHRLLFVQDHGHVHHTTASEAHTCVVRCVVRAVGARKRKQGSTRGVQPRNERSCGGRRTKQTTSKHVQAQHARQRATKRTCDVERNRRDDERSARGRVVTRTTKERIDQVDRGSGRRKFAQPSAKCAATKRGSVPRP